MRTGTVRRRGALLAVLVVAALTLAASRADLHWADPTGYADDCLAVGAAVNAPGQVDGGKLPLFQEADELIGPLTIRRSFDTGLPRAFGSSAAANDGAAGVRSFVSWKPPRGDFRGAAAGRYDEQVRAWARSTPAGVYGTSFHEPENDMTGPEFVALHRHLYDVVKQANPAIRWGPVHMAYWWDPAEPSHYVGDPAAWWVGAAYADFVGLDWYGPEPEPMTTSGSFRHWYEFMEPTGLPLFIVEYGQYAVADGEQRDPAKERARAQAIRTDAAWIADHPRIRMWIYWQGFGDQGDWRIRDRVGQQAWREVAASGCRTGASP